MPYAAGEVFDDFNRADGALGTAPSGQTWSSDGGVISSNQAINNNGFGGGGYIDPGGGYGAIGTLAATIAATGGNWELWFGFSTNARWHLHAYSSGLGRYNLYRRDLASEYLVYSLQTGPYSAVGDRISVEFDVRTSPRIVTVKNNGATLFTVSDATAYSYGEGALVGFHDGYLGCAWDDFHFVPPSLTGWQVGSIAIGV